MPELSIIVPIYNVEAYLPRCIDSVLAQTFTDFELILIDDGSPDRCGEIMEEYAAKDSRIVTIHQENKGVSAARNAGLRIARGTYIGFVDPDDWIEKEMYSQILQSMKEQNAEIGCCSYAFVDQGNKIQTMDLSVPGVMSREGFLEEIFAIPRTLQGAVWNKVFLKEYIKHYFNESVKIGEDWLFLWQYCKNIITAVFIKDTYYFVYENNMSATRKNPDSLAVGLDVSKYLAEEAMKTGRKVGELAERNYLDRGLFFIRTGHAQETRDRVKNEFRQYMISHLLHFLTNRAIRSKEKLLYISILLTR